MNIFKKIQLFLRFKIWAPIRINRYPSFSSSHSQFGEDMVLHSIFGNKRNGFYVDIGAHHPVFFSNTYHFYQKGWRGINIDAAPGSMKIFNLLRKKDINIEACIGIQSNEEVDFYVFDKPALNTFDPAMAKLAKTHSKLLEICHLKTKTLEQCLEEASSDLREIDFLSIDVEGMDEQILRSNNWKKFSPKVIIFESHGLSLENFSQNSLVKYLYEVGYTVTGKMGPSFVAELKS